MPDYLQSEDEFLQLIDRHFKREHPHVLLSRGDDAAVLACPPRTCLTTDMFIENVHFRRSYFSPFEIGYKALAVNVSDASAMGARPLGFSLGLAGPADTPVEFWDGLFAGLGSLASQLNLPLAGGDLNLSREIILAITLWAAPGPNGVWLKRQNCAAGDKLFVAGEIGLARAGLSLLETSGRAACEAWPALCRAHLQPEILLEAGQILAALEGVKGLMDVSDGLARDLPRFLGPGLGASLDIPAEILNPELCAYAFSQGIDPVEFAFLGGEDYALLGAVAPSAQAGLLAALPQARIIGEVRRETGLSLNGRLKSEPGFDHFHAASRKPG